MEYYTAIKKTKAALCVLIRAWACYMKKEKKNRVQHSTIDVAINMHR